MASKAKSDPDGQPVRATTRRYDPAETRLRVLEAAHVLFSSRGYSNTGTADIAAQADVSEGSIFYHFGSKRALMVELGRAHGFELVEAMQGSDPLHMLTFSMTVNRLLDYSEANELLESPSQKPPISKQDADAAPFFHAAREVIQSWMVKRMMAIAEAHGPYDMEIDIAADLLYALVGEGMLRYSLAGNDVEERARVRREMIRFCTAAAGHPALDNKQTNA